MAGLSAEEEENYNHDWYHFLFNHMTKDLINKESFSQMNPYEFSFVSFNYDRSLEYYLWKSFKHSFSEIDENTINTALRSVKIWHVYGQIEYLPWQFKGNERPYLTHDDIIDISILKSLSKNIKVMHNQDRCTENFNEARHEIANANKIYFLGFGFAEENLRVLGIPEILKDRKIQRKIYATNFGETALKEWEIIQLFDGCVQATAIEPFPDHVKVGKSDWDCLRLLREYGI